MVTVAQSPVVIAPQPSVVKPVPPSLASAVPLASGEAPTVGQLVSSAYTLFLLLLIILCARHNIQISPKLNYEWQPWQDA